MSSPSMLPSLQTYTRAKKFQPSSLPRPILPTETALGKTVDGNHPHLPPPHTPRPSLKMLLPRQDRPSNPTFIPYNPRLISRSYAVKPALAVSQTTSAFLNGTLLSIPDLVLTEPGLTLVDSSNASKHSKPIETYKCSIGVIVTNGVVQRVGIRLIVVTMVL